MPDGYNRGIWCALAVALLLVTAGCQGTQSGDSPTETMVPTPTETTVETTEATTTTSAFNPSVSFPSCTAVTVDAERYDWVGIVTTQGEARELPGNYSGEHTFEVNATIQSVLVYGPGDGYVDVENPALGACTASSTTEAPPETAEPTTTAAPTATPTPTPTPTATPTPTTTTTTTTTAVATTSRPPLESHEVPIKRVNASENLTQVTHEIWNSRDHAVSVELRVYFYYDGAPDSPAHVELIAGSETHNLDVPAGERVRVESEYVGNRSIVSVEFEKELEWSES